MQIVSAFLSLGQKQEIYIKGKTQLYMYKNIHQLFKNPHTYLKLYTCISLCMYIYEYKVCPKKVVTRFYFLAIRDKWKV